MGRSGVGLRLNPDRLAVCLTIRVVLYGRAGNLPEPEASLRALLYKHWRHENAYRSPAPSRLYPSHPIQRRGSSARAPAQPTSTTTPAAGRSACNYAQSFTPLSLAGSTFPSRPAGPISSRPPRPHPGILPGPALPTLYSFHLTRGMGEMETQTR